MKSAALVLVCVLCFSTLAAGQQQNPDSIFLSTAHNYQQAQYKSLIGAQAHLYNGVEYKEQPLNSYDKGQPYFISTDWKKGFIQYDGQRYEDVYLQYNLVTEKVIITQHSTANKIELINEKINLFTVDGHSFVNILSGDSTIKNLQPGIYEMLVQGETSVYVKRRKLIQEDLTSGRVVKIFEERNAFFIVHSGKAFPVKNKRDVLQVLEDKSTLIKNQLKRQNIKFNKYFQDAVIFSVKLYNDSI